jgi:hypothetical protein
MEDINNNSNTNNDNNNNNHFELDENTRRLVSMRIDEDQEMWCGSKPQDDNKTQAPIVKSKFTAFRYYLFIRTLFYVNCLHGFLNICCSIMFFTYLLFNIKLFCLWISFVRRLLFVIALYFLYELDLMVNKLF